MVISIDSAARRRVFQHDERQDIELKRKPVRKSHATDPYTTRRIVHQFMLGSGVWQIANREWKTPGYIEQVLRGALTKAA